VVGGGITNTAERRLEDWGGAFLRGDFGRLTSNFYLLTNYVKKQIFHVKRVIRGEIFFGV